MTIVNKSLLVNTIRSLIFLCSIYITNSTYSNTCAGNLLGNPGFEESSTGYAPWVGSGGANISISNDAFSGNNALLISGSAYAKIEQELSVVAGEDFTIAAQIKANASNSYLRIKFKDNAGQLIVTQALEVPASGQFEAYSFPVTAPSNAAFMTISFLKVAQSGDIWLDDFCLTNDDSDPCDTDNTAPTVSDCPADIYLTTSGNSIIANWSAPTVNDACDPSPVLSVNIAPGSSFGLGESTITYTAVDASGNSTTCSFTVTVTQSGPTTCQNNLVNNSGFESTTSTPITDWYVVGSSSVVSLSNDANTGNKAVQMGGTAYTKLQQDVLVSPGDALTLSAQIKATTNNYLIRLRFYNSNGNSISTYQDSEPATGQYVENTLLAIAPNGASYVAVTLLKLPNPGDVLADDFCLTIDNTDPCDTDNTAPTISNCPTDIYLMTSGNSIIANWSAPTVNDVCDPSPVLSVNTASGSSFGLGESTVTYTAVDASGNSTTCSFTVTVTQSGPTTCQNNLVNNSGFESTTTTPITDWYVVGPSSVVSLSNDANTGNMAVQMGGTAYTKLQQDVPVSPGDELTLSAQIKATTNNYLIRLRFYNSNGNSISTYQDSEPTTGQYVENILTAVAPNGASYVAVTLLKLPNPGDVLADDFCLTISGSNPCSTDVQAPVISACPEDISLNNYAPFGVADWIPPLATDNCDPNLSLTSNYASGSEFQLGTTTVIYTATDVSGNASTCSFDVIVTQIGQPGACGNNLVSNSGFEVNDTYLSLWESSGSANISISNDAYAGNNAAQISGTSYGKVEKELYAVAGVEYNLSAQIKATTDNFYLRLKFKNSSGQTISTLLSDQIVTGSYEEHFVSGAAPTGTELLVVSILKTAEAGNVLIDEVCLSSDAVSNCSPDITPPVFIDDLPPAVLTYATSGTLAQANWSTPVVEDNCGSVELTVTHTQDNFFPIGTTTVTYTATDAAGNTATYNFDIVVNFVVNPSGCEGNLLTNPGYEDNFDNPIGWIEEGNDNFFIINQSNIGNNFLQFSGTSSGGIKQILPIQGGETYSLSAEIIDFADIAYMGIKIFDINGQLLVEESVDAPASSEYELHTLLFDAPANSVSIEVAVMRTAGIYQNIKVDNWCLLSTANPIDLTITDAYNEGSVEPKKGGIIHTQVVNNSTENVGSDFLRVNVYLSINDNIISPDDVLVGSSVIEELPLGSNLVDIPFYIPQYVGYNLAYHFIIDIDVYDVVDEINEANNTFSYGTYVNPPSPLNCATHTFDSPYFFHCSNYLPNGNLQIINNSQSGIGLKHEVNADGEVISTSTIGPLPGSANSEVFYSISSGVLTKLSPYGAVVWTKTIPNIILDAYNSLGRATEFDGGIVFTGYAYEGANLPAEDKGLLITKTDIDLNVLEQEQFFTTGASLAFVHDLEPVGVQRLAVVYNEGTNYQGSNKATLMILNETLDVLTSNVISQRTGSVSVIPNTNLLYTACGYWSFRTYSGNAGGGGGFANSNTETLGTYEFQNDEMVAIKTYTTSFQSSGFGGTYYNTNSISFNGLLIDGTLLTANESISNGNGGPPPYEPINSTDTLWMQQVDNGTILWSAFKTPYLQYRFNELVEIGGNHYLLTYGNGYSVVPVDCDENDSPVVGEPNCEASSAFPWHEWISNVTAGGLNNDSEKTAYSDFTNLTPIEAEQGNSIDISVTASYSYYTADEYVSVWIDYNQNDIFESSERTNGIITAPSNGNLASATWNGTLDVPENAEPGLAKMRIVMARDEYAEACGEIPFGEIEDYYVNISPETTTLNSSNNEFEYDLKVFPNPAGETITIDMGDFLSENVEIEIVNNLGNSLYKKEIEELSIAFHKVDLNNWKNGVYMVWVKPENKRRQLAKLVVARIY